jgi:hypothetical protein
MKEKKSNRREEKKSPKYQKNKIKYTQEREDEEANE